MTIEQIRALDTLVILIACLVIFIVGAFVGRWSLRVELGIAPRSRRR